MAMECLRPWQPREWPPVRLCQRSRKAIATGCVLLCAFLRTACSRELASKHPSFCKKAYCNGEKLMLLLVLWANILWKAHDCRGDGDWSWSQTTNGLSVFGKNTTLAVVRFSGSSSTTRTRFRYPASVGWCHQSRSFNSILSSPATVAPIPRSTSVTSPSEIGVKILHSCSSCSTAPCLGSLSIAIDSLLNTSFQYSSRPSQY